MQNRPTWRQQIRQQQKFFTNCCCEASDPGPGRSCTFRKFTFDGKLVWNGLSKTGEYVEPFTDPEDPYVPASLNIGLTPQAVFGISCNNSASSETGMVWTIGSRAIEQFYTTSGSYKDRKLAERRGLHYFGVFNSNPGSASQQIDTITVTNVHAGDTFILLFETGDISQSVSYVATAGTLDNVVDGLIAAIIASTESLVTEFYPESHGAGLGRFSIYGPVGVAYVITAATIGYAQTLTLTPLDSTHTRVTPEKMHPLDQFKLVNTPPLPGSPTQVSFTATTSVANDVVTGLRNAIASAGVAPFNTYTTAEDGGGLSFTITHSAGGVDYLAAVTVDGDVPPDNTQTLTVLRQQDAVKGIDPWRRENKYYQAAGICIDSNETGCSICEAFYDIHYRTLVDLGGDGNGDTLHGWADTWQVRRMDNDFSIIWSNATKTIVFFTQYTLGTEAGEFGLSAGPFEELSYTPWTTINNCEVWRDGGRIADISCTTPEMNHGADTIYVDMANTLVNDESNCFKPQYSWYGLHASFNEDMLPTCAAWHVWENGINADFGDSQDLYPTTPEVRYAGNHRPTAVQPYTEDGDAYPTHLWVAGSAYIPLEEFTEEFPSGTDEELPNGDKVIPDGPQNFVEKYTTVDASLELVWRVQVTRYERVLGMAVPLIENELGRPGALANGNRVFVFGSGFGVGHIITILSDTDGSEIGTITDNPGDHITSMCHMTQYSRLLVTRESGRFSVYDDFGTQIWYADHGASLLCSDASLRNAGSIGDNAHFYVGGEIAPTAITVTRLGTPPTVTTYP